MLSVEHFKYLVHRNVTFTDVFVYTLGINTLLNDSIFCILLVLDIYFRLQSIGSSDGCRIFLLIFGHKRSYLKILTLHYSCSYLLHDNWKTVK